MSKVSEYYHENFDFINERFQEEEKEISHNIDYLSEIEKCKLLGISCNFGICSECELYNKGV